MSRWVTSLSLAALAPLLFAVLVGSSGAGGPRVKLEPHESDELFANPGIGWQTFHTFADEDRHLQGLPSASAFDYALRCHASYLNNKSAPIPEGSRDEIERFLRKIGYRLVLRRVEYDPASRPGSTLHAAMLWENAGVAPPYRDYRLALRLSPASGEDPAPLVSVGQSSIRSWLPGRREVTEPLALPSRLQPGRYELALAVVDPHTREPAVRLAIRGRAADGWYPLGPVEVRAAR